MTDEVNRWRPHGAITLWTYHEQNRNCFGWHLTADPEGCASLIELLVLLGDGGVDARRMIPLAIPRQFPFSGVGDRFGWREHVFASKLKLAFVSNRGPEHWLASVSGSVFSLEVGPHYLSEVLTGTKSISKGGGDFSIGPRTKNRRCRSPENELWFWWHLSGREAPLSG